MVLLAAIWAAGWFAPSDSFTGADFPWVHMALSAGTLAAWNLLGCVIAAGFFHAASKHAASAFRRYRLASLRLLIIGIIFVFPVPIMAQMLGRSPQGRALALLITAMSIATIIFGRARIKLIEDRLAHLARLEDEDASLAPWESGG